MTSIVSKNMLLYLVLGIHVVMSNNNENKVFAEERINDGNDEFVGTFGFENRKLGQVQTFKPGHWMHAHATFYFGDSQTYGGACGYKDTISEGYGEDTAALSMALFNDGERCGACFEIKCRDDDEWCKPGQLSIFVTATDNCPPNYDLPNDDGGWCNPPLKHFDLTEHAFKEIAQYQAGIVPVKYRRVSCIKKGGIRFTLRGNPYYYEIWVGNVGGAGDVTSVRVKGHKKLKWTPLERSWGQVWVTGAQLRGESLTFRVQASDGRVSTSWHIAPKDWQFGQSFQGKNFH